MVALGWLKNLLQPGREQEVEIIRDRRHNVRTQPPEGSTILVVDDSRTVRSVLQRMLQQGGYATLTAENGREALDLSVEHKPTLVIMDIVMPEMNGFQATRALRRHPATTAIPIIIMSGNQEAIDNFWATKIGANDFMMKPFDRKEVYRRLEKILYNNEIL